MRNHMTIKIVSLFLITAVLMSGIVFAAPEQQTEENVQEQVIKTYGEESDTSIRFDFVNGTGKDITFLRVFVNDSAGRDVERNKAIQQALIDQGILKDAADGIVGPKTEAAIREFREKHGLFAEPKIDQELLDLLQIGDGNVLEENEVFKAEEEVVVYYEDPADEVLQDLEYTAVFRLEDDDVTEYVLHTLPEAETSIRILLDGTIPYVEYMAPDSGLLVSTLDSEVSFRQPTPQDFMVYE